MFVLCIYLMSGRCDEDTQGVRHFALKFSVKSHRHLGTPYLGFLPEVARLTKQYICHKWRK